MNPVARALEEDYAAQLAMLGMRRGKAASTCFWVEGSQARALVLCDGFVVTGPMKGDRVKKR